MSIAFFTEMGFKGKIPRDHNNMRTEFAWMVALDADHYHIKDIPNKKYDLGITIIPKNNPEFNIESLKQYCTKVAVMQEGPHWYFQDYTLDKQINYFNALVGQRDTITLMNTLGIQSKDANSILNSNLSDHIILNAGVNVRKLRSHNHQNLLDLMGGQYFLDIDPFYSGNASQSDLNNPNRQIGENQTYGYNYLLHALTFDGFTQFKFSYSNLSPNALDTPLASMTFVPNLGPFGI